MAQTTYRVTLSVDGTHAVSVTGDDPTELSEALAWAKGIYLKLQVLTKDGAADELPPGEPPICEVHGIPMLWWKGRKGYFWTCHERMPDDSWCSYKPPAQ